ncbi:hypothetical protein DAEQUDRAFT_812227 [Daedalea quercina L-15889]|uniref:Uncharacterized protein n=1 Tax=Daedalea quercina L-15889 TaxID=1314783 RepID=A0A165PIN5_9APHY|nr:hypothetical protein DAEQUDRAFT_812227 [Daedalea quercina L-15889]
MTAQTSSSNAPLTDSATMSIRHFSSPAFANGHISFALARKDDVNPNQYMLVLARGYGMAETRRGATLNATTSSGVGDAPSLSSSGHPLIWFDADWEHEAGDPDFPEGGLLNALLAAEPPVVRTTGRTRPMMSKRSEERVAQEVEILLGEDELAHVCCYCGEPELLDVDRWKLSNDDVTRPMYCCSECSKQNAFRKKLTWALRRLRD